MAHTNQTNMSFFSFRVRGGTPVMGINAPFVYEYGKSPRRGVILGPRQRNVIIDRGRELVAFKPIKGAQTLLGSADSAPVYKDGKFVSGSIITIGRQHFIVRPTSDGKYQLLVQTGLPTNPRLALEEYGRLNKEGKLPTAHGYLIDDGTLAIASVEADETVTTEGEEVPTKLQGLVKHIRWAVSRDRVPTTDIPFWREDYLYASPGADIYVFGAYGEQTRLVLQKDGMLRQEDTIPLSARQKFDEQELARIAKRASERAARARNGVSTSEVSAEAKPEETSSPEPKGFFGKIFG